ncbi:Peroxisomal membrane protein 4 (24 kDa peroxisomal intrinsic membrane protein) [Durusdinium trenchii]|uniref:Peroxisomal membrane protein 4 (24 kDa peroxisomal intrinsic membrane protein) n=1 Tax=Durusdinium trenchii TaxID=1381693 RepID=A0ABP0JRJ5_9DINO
MDEEVRFAILSVWRGFRNGLFYGTKIRLPHALVMTLLFRRNADVRKMMDPIAKLTWEHSRNLALFAGFYKLCLAVARIVRVKLGDKIQTPPGVPVTQLDSFLAAALVGHFVWGRYSSVNSQIVMYLMSRVIFALCKVAADKDIKPFANYEFDTVYPWLASITWGLVLWLYEYHPDKLQKSLFDSMDFLYHQTNKWEGGTEDFLPSPATAAIFVYMTLRSRQLLWANK